MHTFYTTGLTHEWQSHERDGFWTLTGDWDMDGTTAKVRCTTVFSDDGDTMTRKWEMSWSTRAQSRVDVLAFTSGSSS
jgi:hypothetical protein